MIADGANRRELQALSNSLNLDFPIYLVEEDVFDTILEKEKLQIPEKDIYPGKPTGKIAYLCVSQRLKWTPVAWAEFNRDKLVFSNIQRGAVMRVATPEGNQLAFLTDPFEMDY